jgi:hypothetical protein
VDFPAVCAAVAAHEVPVARLVFEVPAGGSGADELRALGARVLVDAFEPAPFDLLAVAMPEPERARPILDLAVGFATAPGCRYGQERYEDAR